MRRNKRTLCIVEICRAQPVFVRIKHRIFLVSPKNSVTKCDINHQRDFGFCLNIRSWNNLYFLTL